MPPQHLDLFPERQELLATLKEAGFDAKEARGPFGFGIPGQWIMKKYQAGSSWVGEMQAVLNNTLELQFDGQQMDLAMKPEIYGDVSIIK
jgi:hypothetical protein